MPNIILQRAVFPELIQDEVDAGGDGRRRARRARAGAPKSSPRSPSCATRLGTPGAAERAADLALRWCIDAQMKLTVPFR